MYKFMLVLISHLGHYTGNVGFLNLRVLFFVFQWCIESKNGVTAEIRTN